MTFQFQFENILNMKEKETETALSELNVFKRKKETAEKQVLELVERKESYLKDDQHSMKISLRVTDLLEREQYLAFLEKQIEKAKKKLMDITKEFHLKNHILLEKNKEEKVWSSWREQSLEEYHERTKREEQNSLDEMAVIRYFQRNN